MKKIICVFLTLSIAFAGALTSVSADSATKDPTILLDALSIIDGTEAEHLAAGENISRAAAVYYALKVTNHQDVGTPSGYSFNDVTSSTPYANYIEYGVSIGVISSDDEFRPSDDVTMGEFIKMIEAGLGYNLVANMIGGFPNGYMTLASRLKMLSGLSYDPYDTVPYSSLNKLLTNVLMSSYAKMTGVGSYEATGDENVLYKIFDVYKITGQMTANATTSLTSTTGAGVLKVSFGSATYSVRASVYPALSHELGAKLNAWVYDPDNGADEEIICFEEHQTNETIEIFSEDFDDYVGNTISYSPNNKSKTETIPTSASIIYNGKATTTPITGDVFEGKWGSIRLVKPEGKSVETVVITAYENYYVGGMNKDTFTVFDNTTNNRSISFANSNEDLSENAVFTEKGGGATEFSAITTGVVLSVATPRAVDSASADSEDTYYDVIITRESVTGELKGVTKSEDDLPKALVDANTYSLAPEMDDSRIAEIQAGNTYTFYLDAGGRIAAGVLVNSLSSEMDWVYLIDILEDRNSGDDHLYFKLLTRTGNILSITNAEKVKIDGDVYKDTNLNAIKNMFTNAAGVVHSQVIRLAINEDSEVTRIDTVAKGINENDTDNVRQMAVAKKLYYKKGYSTFESDFAMNAKTAIFCLPTGFNPDAADKGDVTEYASFTVGSIDLWVTDTQYEVTPYNIDIYSQIANVVTYNIDKREGVPVYNSEYVTVVSDICRVVNEDNEAVTQIKGYQAGNDLERTLLYDNVAWTSNTNHLSISETDSRTDATYIAKGDVIRYGLDFEGKINNIQLIYDCSEGAYYHPSKVGGESSLSELDSYSRCMIGMAKAYRMQDGYLSFVINKDKAGNELATNPRDIAPDDQNAVRLINKQQHKVVIVDIQGKNTTISKSSFTAIKDWYNYGQDASYMLVQDRYDEGRTIVIYNYKD